MKKILLMSLIISSSFNSLLTRTTYIHLANDTNQDIKVEISYYSRVRPNSSGYYILTAETIAKAYNVNFFTIQNIYDGYILTITAYYPIANATGDNRYIKTSLDVTKMSYYAFHLLPTTGADGKPSCIIRQRTEKDAELILEKHKSPTNPQYIN